MVATQQSGVGTPDLGLVTPKSHVHGIAGRLSSASMPVLGLDDDGGHVVLEAVFGEIPNGAEECVKDFIWRLLLVLPNDTERAFQAEKFISR
jgi:hypothetical protein